MTTFYDKLKVQSRLYLDSLTQQDETLQMDLRNFLVDNRRQLMVVQSVISYLMVKDILRNFEKLGANIKSKYSDPTCLTWEQCGSIVKTSKMILTLPKLIILDYNKSDFCSDDSKLLKILLNNDSVHKSTTNKIVIVLSAESKNLTNNFECFLSENYGKLAYSDKKLDLKYRDEVQKANSLIEAASLGNFYQVMHFIDDNSDINMRDKINITALHEAAEKGNAEIVLFLLEHGATQLPNLSNKYPLHLACFNGHNHIVSILIEYGADLAKEDDMKQNALNFASYKDHPNIIETLLYYGVQVDALNSMKDTSLHIAAYAGSFEAVKVLIKNGANRKLLNNENKSAAELAQAHGHQHIADYLNQDEPQEKELIQNDSLKQQDETLQMDLRNFLVDNRRQLMVVQSVISYLMVKDILRNFEKLGANIKSKYSDPTCLTWEQCGSIVKTSKMILTLPKLIILDYNKSDFCSDDSKLLKILLNNDSIHTSTTNKIVIVLSAESKNLTNNFECFLSENYGKLAYSDKKLDLKYRDEVQKANSLIEAASLGNYYQVMHFIDDNSDINMRGKNNITALHEAAEKGNAEIVLFLLEHGATQLPNRSNKYPLHLACFNGHNHIVNILIEYGADLAKEDYMKQNALDSASCKDHPNIIETLLHYGAQVDALNSMKETPLHIAAYAGSFEAVKVLIKNGANRKLLNNQNKSAAELAQANGHQHIADYLNQDEPQEKELIQNGQ